MKYSIIIPAYNEENGINTVIQQLLPIAAQLGDTEIVVVDDGSTDKTAEIIQEIKGIKALFHPKNKGYGASLKTGIRGSTGDIVIITDADCTYPNEQIPQLIKYVESGSKMAVGARVGKNAAIPLIRRPAKYFLKVLSEYLSNAEIPDLNSGLRAISRDILEENMKLLPDGFSFTTTITLAALCDGHDVHYHQIEYHPRTGKSKIAPIADTLRFIQLIFRTVLFFNPLKVFLPFAFLMIFSGLAIMLISAILFDQVMDITTIVLILSGFQTAGMGLLADLIVRRATK